MTSQSVRRNRAQRLRLAKAFQAMTPKKGRFMGVLDHQTMAGEPKPLSGVFHQNRVFRGAGGKLMRQVQVGRVLVDRSPCQKRYVVQENGSIRAIV